MPGQTNAHTRTTLLSKPSRPIRTACFSSAGTQREHNEDACALPAVGADEGRYGTLLVVADGVGGMAGGAAASKEAVQYLQALYYADTGPSSLAERLRRCVEAVNAINRLKLRQPGQEKSGLTTLVAALVYRDQVWVANVGDSRAYLIQAEDGRGLQLTEDHSRHNRGGMSGAAEAQDDSREQAGVINRAIGLEDQCQVDIYHYTWSPDDRLVLCSDGLSSLSPDDMAQLAFHRPVERAAKALVARAVELDGSDNCTAAVAAWDNVSPPPAAHASSPQAARERGRAGTPAWRGVLPPLLLGLSLGWLTALLVLAYWLDASGILDLF